MLGNIHGVGHSDFPGESVIYWLNLDFRSYWLELYNLARRVNVKGQKAKWSLILSHFAYLQAPLDHILALHTIAINFKIFQCLNPPPYDEYTDCSESEFDRFSIKKLK